MPHDEVSALQDTVSRRSCVRGRTKRSDSVGSPWYSSPPPLQHTRARSVAFFDSDWRLAGR